MRLVVWKSVMRELCGDSVMVVVFCGAGECCALVIGIECGYVVNWTAGMILFDTELPAF